MVRGNWQRRVERTEARRTAAKQKKERAKQKRDEKSSSGGGDTCDHEASYRRLEDWLDEKGDGIGVLYEDNNDAKLEGGDTRHSSQPGAGTARA